MSAAIAWIRNIAGLIVAFAAACLLVLARGIAASEGKRLITKAILDAVKEAQ